jgi:phage baseplate assembly protein W
MARRFFTGFSTSDNTTRQRVYHDLDLCRKDLMNHFHTRRGERVMRPTWGCGLWDYVMEPLTPSTRELIKEEARGVINADSRCDLISIDVEERQHGFIVHITFNFVPESVVDTFTVEFDRRNSSLFS